MSRTNTDFSKHIIEVYKSGGLLDSEGLLVHYFRKPGTLTDAIKFINTNGILAVTGDYGNWIFCREFHPSADGAVCGGYWHEKLRIASSQVGDEFDSDATKKVLLSGIRKDLKKYGYTGERLEKAKEYYRDCLNYVDYSEFEYTAFAYENMPGFFDSEMVPFVKKLKYWLLVVFDAFDEICKRMKDEAAAAELLREGKQ